MITAKVARHSWLSSQDDANAVIVNGKKYSDVAVLEYHGLENVFCLIFAF